ncbi:hypothetical protein BFG60_1154 [Microcystis aeruginosa NIES-98]|nr:hypothetical protein BFG60_1154 [Microcystis aeruginosa NIES-98]
MGVGCGGLGKLTNQYYCLLSISHSPISYLLSPICYLLSAICYLLSPNLLSPISYLLI